MGESWRNFTAPAEVESVATTSERRTRSGRAFAAWIVLGLVLAALGGLTVAVAIWLVTAGAVLIWFDRKWTRSDEGQLVLRANAHADAINQLASRGEILARSTDGSVRKAAGSRAASIVNERLAAARLDDVVEYGSRVPRKALRTAGLVSLRQLLGASESQLVAIRGISEKGAAETLRAANRCAEAIRAQPVPVVDFVHCPKGDHGVLIALERRRLATAPELSAFAASLRSTTNGVRTDIEAASDGLTASSWIRRFVGFAPPAVDIEHLAGLVAQFESAEVETTLAAASDYLGEVEREIDGVNVADAVDAARSGRIGEMGIVEDDGSVDNVAIMRAVIGPARGRVTTQHPMACAGVVALLLGGLLAATSSGSSIDGPNETADAARVGTTDLASTTTAGRADPTLPPEVDLSPSTTKSPAPTSSTTTSTTLGNQAALSKLTSWLDEAPDLAYRMPADAEDYDRASYEHWSDLDGNCMDTRDDLLVEAARWSRIDGCDVVAGSWLDAYIGLAVGSLSDASIDHVVPLSLTHELGGHGWSPETREAFANDPLNLVVTSRDTNESKAALSPVDWKPERAEGDCLFGMRWLATKYKWGLPIGSENERTAVVALLDRCVGEPDVSALPSGTDVVAGDPGWAVKPMRGEPSERSSTQSGSVDAVERESPETTLAPITTTSARPTTTIARPTTTTAKPTTTTARPTTTTAKPTTTTERPTTTAPPPTTAAPAPSGCHPSYTGACLKQGQGDYDCSGGTGNGPNYTGPVNVVGPDDFGLDRDDDGLGCENS